MALPVCFSVATLITLKLIPAPQASIIVSESSVHLNANISAICVFIDGFRLFRMHHCTQTGHKHRYPCENELEIPHTSKHWRTLFIELSTGMVQIFICYIIPASLSILYTKTALFFPAALLIFFIVGILELSNSGEFSSFAQETMILAYSFPQ